MGNVPRNNKYDSFLKMATGCNDDLNEDMLQPHGSFMAEEENLNIKMMNDYYKFFNDMQDGQIIPPGPFQDWLHPDFKRDYTRLADGYTGQWLRICKPASGNT